MRSVLSLLSVLLLAVSVSANVIGSNGVRADQLRRRETIRRSWAAPALSRRQNSNQAAVFGALGPAASAQLTVSSSCGPSGTPDPNNAQAVSDCNNAKQAQSAAFTGLQAAVNNYMPPGPTCPASCAPAPGTTYSCFGFTCVPMCGTGYTLSSGGTCVISSSCTASSSCPPSYNGVGTAICDNGTCGLTCPSGTTTSASPSGAARCT